jgi:hypothetical protein
MIPRRNPLGMGSHTTSDLDETELNPWFWHILSTPQHAH